MTTPDFKWRKDVPPVPAIECRAHPAGGFVRLESLPDNRPERYNEMTKKWEPTPPGAVVHVITGYGRSRSSLGFPEVESTSAE
jgi:hypothetical protein